MLKKIKLSKYKVEKIGKGAPVLSFIVGVHGNELAPVKAINLLKKNIESAKIKKAFKVIYANCPAIDCKTRFIEKDLNMSFPGKKNGFFEERLAYDLSSELDDGFKFDFHTTTFPVSPYCLIFNYENKIKNILNMIGIKNCLFIDKESTIKHLKNCIGLEVGMENDEKTVFATLKIMNDILVYFGVIDGKLKKTSGEVKSFLIYGIIKKEGLKFSKKLEDFVEIKKGNKICLSKDGKTVRANESFYPIWVDNPLIINKAKRIII